MTPEELAAWAKRLGIEIRTSKEFKDHARGERSITFDKDCSICQREHYS